MNLFSSFFGTPQTVSGSPVGSMMPQYQSGIVQNNAGGYPKPQTGASNGWFTNNAGWIVPLASLLGTLGSSWISARSQRRANNANIREAQKQREWDLMMWEKMNQYNSPESQMQRYLDAGMSPWTAVGQGSSGNAGSSPSAKAPHIEAEIKNMDLTTSLAMIGQYQDYLLKNKQIKSLTTSTELQSERINSEILKQLSERVAQEKGQAYLTKVGLETDLLRDTLDYSVEYAKQRNAYIDSQTEKNLYELGKMMPMKYEELKYRVESMLPAELHKTEMSSKLTNAIYQMQLSKNQVQDDLTDDGLMYTDKWWLRTLQTWFNDMMNKSRGSW